VRRAPAWFVAAVLVAAGCGGGNGEPTIKVSAAASLKRAFQEYAKGFKPAQVSFSFAGSDELAAQIREGLKPDAFAAANTKLPADLYAKGLVDKPVVFASNRLVIAVPKGTHRVASIADLSKSGVRIAAGSATVPVGSYTRQVLGRLDAAQGRAIEQNIRSDEPDVAGIVGKVASGAVDAGFVYVTDVSATKDRLAGIALPARLQPRVLYGAAVVKGAPHPAEAREFITGLLSGDGGRALAAAGFGRPVP